MKVLVTGVAGFIGFHVANQLISRGDEVVGIDNLSDYYDVQLKTDRLQRLIGRRGFQFTKIDIADRTSLSDYFRRESPQRVVHLAAQAGVRYSIKNPYAYADSNLLGFVDVLEGCRQVEVEHLLYASSSSVYGANLKIPFCIEDNVDHPLSLYAATKKANELMAHTYSHLYGLPTTGLRFFTVYGPWGRPDMAPFLFTKAILEDHPINVFNHGNMQRDFTYVDDIVECVLRVLDKVPQPRSELTGIEQMTLGASAAPYQLYNIGNQTPVDLLCFIRTIEKWLDRKAQLNFLPMQAGDVSSTFADVGPLINDIGFAPKTTVDEGIADFVKWYKSYYKV